MAPPEIWVALDGGPFPSCVRVFLLLFSSASYIVRQTTFVGRFLFPCVLFILIPSLAFPLRLGVDLTLALSLPGP